MDRKPVRETLRRVSLTESLLKALYRDGIKTEADRMAFKAIGNIGGSVAEISYSFALDTLKQPEDALRDPLPDPELLYVVRVEGNQETSRWTLYFDRDEAARSSYYRLYYHETDTQLYPAIVGDEPAYQLRVPGMHGLSYLYFMPLLRLEPRFVVKEIPGDWRLASGEVVVDRQDSHLHPGVVFDLKEVLATIHSGFWQRAGVEVITPVVRIPSRPSQPRRVGTAVTGSVLWMPGQKVVYGRRYGRSLHDAFVIRTETSYTTSISMILLKREDGIYEILTARYGKGRQGERRVLDANFYFNQVEPDSWSEEPPAPEKLNPWWVPPERLTEDSDGP